MSKIYNKKVETRFSIQFNQANPEHVQVADILNRQACRSKAQYIVNAVLHYESRNEAHNDEKHIELVVNRILLDKEKSGPGIMPGATPYKQMRKQPQPTDDIIDDTEEPLGADGVSVVNSALDMFRKKR